MKAYCHWLILLSSLFQHLMSLHFFFWLCLSQSCSIWATAWFVWIPAERKDIYFRLVFTLNNSYLYAVAFEPLLILQVYLWKIPLVCLCDKCYYNKVYKMSHFARAAWGADRSNGLWQEETKYCKEEGRNLFLPV